MYANEDFDTDENFLHSQKSEVEYYACNILILKFVLFADDITIFTSDKIMAKQFSITNRELNNV